jgi:hypothetical protein
MSFLNPDMQFDDLGFAEGDSGAVFAGTDSKHTQLTVHVPGGHYNGMLIPSSNVFCPLLCYAYSLGASYIHTSTDNKQQVFPQLPSLLATL